MTIGALDIPFMLALVARQKSQQRLVLEIYQTG